MERERTHGSADRVAADEPGAVAGAGGAGVCGRSGDLLSGVGECVFDLERLSRHLRSCGEPIRSERQRPAGDVVSPAGRQAIHRGSRSGGGGAEGDYSCAQVIERRTAMQCAELHGHFPPRELAVKMIALGSSYNDALLVVERNNHGYGVLAHLRAEGARMYFATAGRMDG